MDRGADLSDISQYPAEKEILFPPLTALQVVSRRVHDKALILEVRPTCNTHSLTISEVIGKRAKLLLDMESNMRLEISRDLSRNLDNYEHVAAAKAAFSELLKYNSDFAVKCAAAKEAPSQPDITWRHMVTKQMMAFNEGGGNGDRLFGEAVSYTLDMKVKAVESVHEFFAQLDDKTPGRLDLSGKCLGRRASSTIPLSYPVRMLIYSNCLHEKSCEEFSMINL